MTQLGIGLLAAQLVQGAPLAAAGQTAGPADFSLPPQTSEIYGGMDLGACEWPTAVAMSTSCSGTLIHPEVVLYAAHCGAGFGAVGLTEIAGEGATAETEYCVTNPDWSGNPGGDDFALCKLTQPLDLAVSPILMGCELNELVKGREVTSVGYGIGDMGPKGVKRAVSYPIENVVWENNWAIVGGLDGKGLCTGDSGGPTFLEMPDGTWRIFGVSSAILGECGTAGIVALAHEAVPWIEMETGIDVTPCHDADGTWNPGPDCDGYPLDPEIGVGAQPMCGPGPLSGPLGTCGAPFDAPPDDTPPTVTITDPADMTLYPDSPATIEVHVDAVDNDGGWGVANVWLEINGMEVEGTEDDYAPYVIESLMFNTGVYEFIAHAEDYAGNEAVSAPVTIAVATEFPEETTTTGDDTTGDDTTGDETTTGTEPTSGPMTSAGPSGTGDSDNGTTDEPTDDDGGDEGGCGCSQGRDAPAAPLWALAGFAGLLRLRRRRER